MNTLPAPKSSYQPPHPAFLACELFILLGCIPPLMLFGAIYQYRHFILLSGCVYIIWRLRTAVNLLSLFGRPTPSWWCGPVLRGGLLFLFTSLYVFIFTPDAAFSLPLTRPKLWLMVMVFYPFLSALPQELIYRVFLFEVHHSLWKHQWIAVIASSIFFAWAHIIYTGWFAVITCFIGGISLSLTYQKNRIHTGGIWSVWLEHSLYGLCMFTVGLGKYFFIAR